MTRSIIIISLAAVVLSACSNIREYELPEVEPYVVIDAIISTDSTWVVNLNYSRPINAIAPPRKVEGAEIQVSILIDGNLGATEDNIAQKLQLDEFSPGLYSLANNPTEGKTYHMEVRLDDEYIYAKTYVPKVFTPEINTKNSSEDGSFQLEVDLGSELEAGIHYAYSLVPNNKPKQSSEDDEIGADDGQGTDEADSEGNIQQGNEVALTRNSGLDSATPISISSTNNLGGNSGIIIESNLNSIQPIEENQTTTTGTSNSSSKNSDQFTLRIWAISSEYYQYLVSRKDNDFKPSSEFELQNRYSNVQNGGGIFAGYNLKEIPVEF